MVYSSKKMQLIERYFNDDLSPEELAFFNNEMKNDEAFESEVKKYEFVYGSLKEIRARKLKSDFQDYEAQLHVRKPKFNLTLQSVLRYSAVATVAVLLTITAINFSHPSPHIVTEEVFSEFFRPYPNVIAPITRSSDISDSDLLEVMNLYDSKDYDSAIEGFNSFISNSELRNEMLFYKGVALLAKGEAEDARKHFEMMDTSSNFSNQRKWYLSLALVQLEEVDEARKLLNEIIVDQSYFVVYAKGLLEVLSPK